MVYEPFYLRPFYANVSGNHRLLDFITKRVKMLMLTIRREHIANPCYSNCLDEERGLPSFEQIYNLGRLCSILQMYPYTSYRRLDLVRLIRYKLRKLLERLYRCSLKHNYTTATFCDALK